MIESSIFHSISPQYYENIRVVLEYQIPSSDTLKIFRCLRISSLFKSIQLKFGNIRCSRISKLFKNINQYSWTPRYITFALFGWVSGHHWIVDQYHRTPEIPTISHRNTIINTAIWQKYTLIWPNSYSSRIWVILLNIWYIDEKVSVGYDRAYYIIMAGICFREKV
jgi:hypothetical protein